MSRIPAVHVERTILVPLIAFTTARNVPVLFLSFFAATLTAAVLTLDKLPGDLAASAGFQAFNTPWLLDMMLFGDLAGGNQWLFALLGVSLLTCAALRRWRDVSVLAVSAGFFALSPLLKLAIQRPRPWVEGFDAVINPAGYSFPSGHALGSGLIFGSITLVVVLALRGRPLLQVAVASAGLGVIMIVGASRVFLGAHWTSDVVAGYVLAALFLLIAWRIVRYGAQQLRPAAVRSGI